MPRGTPERAQSADVDNEAPLSRASGRVLYIGCDRPIRISTGHRLLHHDGKCGRSHGHNYKISVRVASDLTGRDWVVNKGIVTDAIDEWDCRFSVEPGDPLVEVFECSGDVGGTVALDAPSTAEAMVVVLEERLLAALPGTVPEVSVSVSETSEFCAGL